MTNVNNMVLPVFQTVLLITILVLVILNYTKIHQGFQNREGFASEDRTGKIINAADIATAKRSRKFGTNIGSAQIGGPQGKMGIGSGGKAQGQQEAVTTGRSR
jgi:hypothetical protein